MAFVDLTKPGEKKKVIWASILGLVAIIFLWWTFVGFGSSPSSRASVRPTATPTPARAGGQPTAGGGNQRASSDVLDIKDIRPISFERSSYDAPEAQRNIFAYYVPPPKPVAPPKVESTPEPSPAAAIVGLGFSRERVRARAGIQTRRLGRQVHSRCPHLCRRQRTADEVHQSATAFDDRAGFVYRESGSARGDGANSRQCSLLERSLFERRRSATSQLRLHRHHRQDESCRRCGHGSGQEQQEHYQCSARRST